MSQPLKPHCSVDILLCHTIARGDGAHTEQPHSKECDWLHALRVINPQSPRWPAAQSCREEDSLRRPQRPGNQNAQARSEEPSGNSPSRIAGTAGLPQCSSRRSGHLTFLRVTVRLKEIDCNTKLVSGCAEVVDSAKFLWKVLEKMERIGSNSGVPMQRKRKSSDLHLRRMTRASSAAPP